jgi:hypothetical protein
MDERKKEAHKEALQCHSHGQPSQWELLFWFLD